MKISKSVISIGLIGIMLGGVLVGCESRDDSTSKEDKEETKQVETTTETKDEIPSNVETEEAKGEDDTYKAGMYKVGKDIQSGLYKVERISSDNGAYLERASSADLTFESIIANQNINGDFYARIQETDEIVKIENAKATKIEIDELPVDIKDELTDGIYIVGKDIEVGNYKVEHINMATYSTYEEGYVGRLKDVNMNFEDIIANGTFENQGYIDIEEGDFAVEITGAKLTKQ